jgi:hypothetical protein
MPSTPIFREFTPADTTDVLVTEVTTGLWSPDETGSLKTMFSSSNQIAVSGEFYYDIYNENPNVTSTNAEVQFAVAYGHVDGGGSPTLATDSATTLPTKVIYSQYRNILLTSGSKFKFGGVESDDIYVINVNRARFKQALDPGNWQLGLSGSNGVFTFIDDFGSSTVTEGNVIASNAYNVLSGSIVGATTITASSTVYGTVFPDYGAIILYPAAISASVGFSGSNSNTLNAKTLLASNIPFTPYTGSAATDYQYQHEGLVRSISGSMRAGQAFVARSVEKISSKNYSVYLSYNDYNYSTNPSYYINTSNGKEILPAFKNKSLSYITTIGLYNDQNELVAVAKLSRPLQKSKDKSALIRVRLDY